MESFSELLIGFYQLGVNISVLLSLFSDRVMVGASFYTFTTASVPGGG